MGQWEGHEFCVDIDFDFVDVLVVVAAAVVGGVEYHSSFVIFCTVDNH